MLGKQSKQVEQRPVDDPASSATQHAGAAILSSVITTITIAIPSSVITTIIATTTSIATTTIIAITTITATPEPTFVFPLTTPVPPGGALQ